MILIVSYRAKCSVIRYLSSAGCLLPESSGTQSGCFPWPGAYFDSGQKTAAVLSRATLRLIEVMLYDYTEAHAPIFDLQLNRLDAGPRLHH